MRSALQPPEANLIWALPTDVRKGFAGSSLRYGRNIYRTAQAINERSSFRRVMALSGFAPKGARVHWITRSYKFLAPNGAKTVDRTAC